MDDLQRYRLSKEMILSMAIKVVNNTVGLNALVSIFLVFGPYSYMSEFDIFIFTITQYVVAIKNAMKEVQKVRAEK